MSTTTPDIAKEKLAKDFDSVVAQTQDLLQSVSAAGGEQADTLRASVEDAFALASERLAKIRAEALERVGGAARATDEFVHEDPWRAVGIAAGLAAVAGLVAGLLLSRR